MYIYNYIYIHHYVQYAWEISLYGGTCRYESIINNCDMQELEGNTPSCLAVEILIEYCVESHHQPSLHFVGSPSHFWYVKYPFL